MERASAFVEMVVECISHCIDVGYLPAGAPNIRPPRPPESKFVVSQLIAVQRVPATQPTVQWSFDFDTDLVRVEGHRVVCRADDSPAGTAGHPNWNRHFENVADNEAGDSEQ